MNRPIASKLAPADASRHVARVVALCWPGLSLLLTGLSGEVLAGEPPVASRARQHTVLTSGAYLPGDVAAYARQGAPLVVADTVLLASYSFDDGGPSTMGWTEVDMTDQAIPYFHVASDLGGGELTGGTFGTLFPLSGSKSIWCGVPPGGAEPWCGYGTLPGYGHNWEQYFESHSFNGLTPPFSIDYYIQWDTEPDYDVVRLQARIAGQWVDVPDVNGGAGVYDSYGFLVESIGLDPDTERLRFAFRSDELWSDEDGLWPTDGAVLLDNLTVNDAGGVVTFEDFEDEGDSDTATDTGWQSKVPAGFGEFGDLYPGTTVPQADLWFQNESHLWAWFDGLSGKIPFGPDGSDLYFHNAIESPEISVPGSGGQYLLSFKVYRDLPFENHVFYYAAVTSVVGGCRQSFWSDYPLVYGDEKGWIDEEIDVSGCVEPGAEAVVIRIGVVDVTRLFGAGLDHTHAPLVDDVSLRRVDTGGPGIGVQYADLFQDNFPQDGTTGGTARADMASDILSTANPNILPGDSICVTAQGVGTDAFTGKGPSVYCYVSVWPPGQSGKTGADIEAPDKRTGGFGKRYPLVDTQIIGGVTWDRFRMDYAFVVDDLTAPNRYCFDLEDAIFEPGDTICYFFAADDGAGNVAYWSRRRVGRSIGQGDGFVTSSIAIAAANPCEFQILPGGGWQAGGDILYVDDADDRGGPTQLFFDQAFDQLGILDQVDRFDVLGPSLLDVNNSLASRVTNVLTQLAGCYRKIIWCSGDLSSGLIGDGVGMEKSDDFSLLFAFLDQHPDNPGLYLSGDNIHREWSTLSGAGAIGLRSLYYDFALTGGDHVALGEPVSPLIVLSGSCFSDPEPDTLFAFGGCPVVNRFDVLSPLGSAVSEAVYPSGGGSAVLSQTTANSAASTARVIGSGFSFHYIRDDRPAPVPDRVEHLRDILIWLQNSIAEPTGLDGGVTFFNSLGDAYPNPFNPVTTLRFSIEETGPVSLRVYNVAGQLVRTLVEEIKTPRVGGYSVTWDGTTESGAPVASGVYFIKFTAKGYSATKKLALLR